MGIAPGAACSLFIFLASNHESRPYKITPWISLPECFFWVEPSFCKKLFLSQHGHAFNMARVNEIDNHSLRLFT